MPICRPSSSASSAALSDTAVAGPDATLGSVRPRAVVTVALIGAIFLTNCSTDPSVRATGAVPIGAPPLTTEVATDSTIEPPDETTVDSTIDPPTAAPDVAPIDWGACDDPEVTEDEFECATVAAPLDYTKPDGETIELALVRIAATDDRVGAILFNPGGPGGSGFDYIAQAGTTMVGEMGLEGFDLIGFDPRGVDRSGGIRCLTDEQVDATIYLDSSPDTPDEQAAAGTANRRLWRGR